jgi:hypothetical protein
MMDSSVSVRSTILDSKKALLSAIITVSCVPNHNLAKGLTGFLSIVLAEKNQSSIFDVSSKKRHPPTTN